MKYVKHAGALTLFVMAWSVPMRAAQEPAAAPAQVTLTPAQMEGFLLRATILRMRDAGDGITGSRRATMSDGALTHDAHIQVINQLSRFEVQAVLARRDAIVKLFDAKIAERGEAPILYSLPAPTLPAGP